LEGRYRTKALVEASLITAIAVIFTLAGIYIPLLGYALMLIPVPFIIIGAKHGIKYNILSVIAAALIVGSFTDPMRALFISIFGGLSSLVIGSIINKRDGFRKALLFGSIATLVASVILLTLLSYVSGISVTDIIEESFNFSADINFSIYESLGMDPKTINETKNMMENIKNMSLMLLPSSVIFGSVIFTYLNYTVSGVILRRIGTPVERPGRFSEFRLPRNFLLGSLLIVFLSFIAGKLNIVDFNTLFTNVFYLFFITYLIQGLSVAYFFLEKRGISRGFRVFIVILLLLIPNTGLILMFIGFFDMLFNIRKLEM